MYPSVCVCVIALIFLSLENVSSCKSSWFCKPEDSPRKGNSGNKKDSKNFTCVHRYLDGNQQEAIVEHNITSEQIKFEEAHFIINVEIFDNNTEIYCTEDGNKAQKYTSVNAEIGANQTVFYFNAASISNQRTLFMATNKTAIVKAGPAILKYNDTENVFFNCPERNNETNSTGAQLGIINPSSNMIKTFRVQTLNQEFNKTHNGTILCCIYYEVSGKEEWRITRHVDRKTLLVYDDANDVNDKDDGLQETLKRTEMSTNEPNTHTDDFVPGNDTDLGSQTNKYVIATAAMVAVFILIVVIVIWKKRCREKPKSNAKVLYADLDLLRQRAPETSQRPKPSPGPGPGPEEESPYAQIIGEMRPQ